MRSLLVTLVTCIVLLGCQPEAAVPSPEQLAAIKRAEIIRQNKANIEAYETAERERVRHPHATAPGNAWWREDNSTPTKTSEPQPTDSTGSKK